MFLLFSFFSSVCSEKMIAKENETDEERRRGGGGGRVGAGSDCGAHNIYVYLQR